MFILYTCCYTFLYLVTWLEHDDSSFHLKYLKIKRVYDEVLIIMSSHFHGNDIFKYVLTECSVRRKVQVSHMHIKVHGRLKV